MLEIDRFLDQIDLRKIQYGHHVLAYKCRALQLAFVVTEIYLDGYIKVGYPYLMKKVGSWELIKKYMAWFRYTFLTSKTPHVHANIIILYCSTKYVSFTEKSNAMA